MRTRDVLGFVLLPVALLLAGRWVQELRLWDFLANLCLPWLCSTVAISVLILGVTCFLCQTTPVGLSGRVAFVVVAGVSVMFGVGMLVDMYAYRDFDPPPDWAASVGGWVGFVATVIVVFVIPRRRSPPSA